MRKVKFETDSYYHIFNRGVDKRKVFIDKFDFLRFLNSLREFNQIDNHGGFYEKYLRNKKSESGDSVAFKATESPDRHKLVEIIAYCLNVNHYHLLVKQLTTGGISAFMKKIAGGYSSYFNSRYKRSGSLWQGAFKAIEVNSDYHLAGVSAYINGNPEIHGISKAEKWVWSSCLDYLGKRNGTLCQKNEILSQFDGVHNYKHFLTEIIKESSQRKKDIKKYLLE